MAKQPGPRGEILTLVELSFHCQRMSSTLETLLASADPNVLVAAVTVVLATLIYCK